MSDRETLSPLLFNIVLDFVMRKVELAGDGIDCTAGTRLRDLVYAEDICLLANDLHDMRRMTEAVVCKAAKDGFWVNMRKTELMNKRTEDTS